MLTSEKYGKILHNDYRGQFREFCSHNKLYTENGGLITNNDEIVLLKNPGENITEENDEIAKPQMQYMYYKTVSWRTA